MQSPFQFLIETIFNIYIMVILLRFFLQLFRADFYNPLSQFVVRATNPVLKPLRQVIPGFGGLDISSIIFAIVVSLLKLILIYGVLSGSYPTVAQFIVISLADVVSQAFDLIFYMIFIRIIMSWINPGLHNPIMSVIYQLTEPLMGPVRRILPPMGGLDLSPILLLLGLKFLNIAINSWIFAPLFQSL